MLLEGDDEAHHPSAYSRDNGRRWTTIDEYVQNCAWARDARLAADPNEILCESFRDKKGSQRMFGGENPLELVVGGNYYTKVSLKSARSLRN